MSNIKIVCDSLSDIPSEYIEKYNISIVPLSVIFDGKEYIDGVDINKDEFYKMLRDNDNLPKTSQVTYIKFKEEFEKHIKQGYEVLYIGGSSNASGTYQSAVMAKNDIEGGVVVTFDTLSLSLGCGCMVISAAKLAQEGKCIDEILNHLDNTKKNSSVLFTVETLEYLQKGGRISLAKATIGNMLNIKPILCIDDGLVKPISQVRGKKQVIGKIIEILKDQHGDDFSNKYVIIGCGDNKSDLEVFKKRLIEEFKNIDCLEVNMGSCICAHSGPGVLGIGCVDK
ncbi:DegV family protein [Romboutsia lituseburensis]|uniref:DegV family protein n=1 Tax=Romboutsia lituseburensis TaxID=1537 RepID=UPI0022EB6553|nr:DegV family protein [Romboutsia lituseburensis]